MRNKTRSFLHIHLFIKDSSQQQIHFDDNVIGNKHCRCNEGSLSIQDVSQNKCVFFLFYIMLRDAFCHTSLVHLIMLLVNFFSSTLHQLFILSRWNNLNLTWQMSFILRKRTIRYVRPKNTQISLRTCAVKSESSLSVWRSFASLTWRLN